MRSIALGALVNIKKFEEEFMQIQTLLHSSVLSRLLTHPHQEVSPDLIRLQQLFFAEIASEEADLTSAELLRIYFNF